MDFRTVQSPLLDRLIPTPATDERQKIVERPDFIRTCEDTYCGRGSYSPEELRRHEPAIARARARAFSPAQIRDIADRLGAMDIDSPEFRLAVSNAPLEARLEVFQRATPQELQVASRRIRGMLKSSDKLRVSSPSITLFELTNDTYNAFRKIFGPNVVWFFVTPPAAHLHTVIADQGDENGIHHNTYGRDHRPAQVNNRMQYGLPVLLTDAEMDRFLRYMEAGTAQYRVGRETNEVYGFFTSSGKVIKGSSNVRCTNWATSAPIGDLPRWVGELEERIHNSVAAQIPAIAQAGGLHAALAAAETQEDRQAVIDAVLAVDGLSSWTSGATQRLHEEFEKYVKEFPRRPRDLIMRESLAEIFELSRSQDPAKWTYDLLLSPKVPMMAVSSPSPLTQRLEDMTLQMEIMGDILPDGTIVKNRQGGLGVIPEDRRPQPQPQTDPVDSPAVTPPAPVSFPAGMALLYRRNAA